MAPEGRVYLHVFAPFAIVQGTQWNMQVAQAHQYEVSNIGSVQLMSLCGRITYQYKLNQLQI